jgi:hypothetical protein
MWRVWGRKEGCTVCWWGNLRERDRWGDPDVDEKNIIKMDFLEVGVGCRGLMKVAQDRDRWRALVSTVTGSIKCGESFG